MPLVANRSFAPHGRPCSGPRYLPALISRSASAACCQRQVFGQRHVEVQRRLIALEPRQVHLREFGRRHELPLDERGEFRDRPERDVFEIRGPLQRQRRLRVAHRRARRRRALGFLAGQRRLEHDRQFRVERNRALPQLLKRPEAVVQRVAIAVSSSAWKSRPMIASAASIVCRLHRTGGLLALARRSSRPPRRRRRLARLSGTCGATGGCVSAHVSILSRGSSRRRYSRAVAISEERPCRIVASISMPGAGRVAGQCRRSRAGGFDLRLGGDGHRRRRQDGRAGHRVADAARDRSARARCSTPPARRWRRP